ncbi:MAG TPA: hypothetical protein VF789_25440 [Thermoanaerobaculia bacterium]
MSHPGLRRGKSRLDMGRRLTVGQGRRLELRLKRTRDRIADMPRDRPAGQRRRRRWLLRNDLTS